jgi:hypothetical protein
MKTGLPVFTGGGHRSARCATVQRRKRLVTAQV